MHEWHLPCRAITSEVWKNIGLCEAASGANDASGIIVQHVRPAHPDESSVRVREAVRVAQLRICPVGRRPVQIYSVRSSESSVRA